MLDLPDVDAVWRGSRNDSRGRCGCGFLSPAHQSRRSRSATGGDGRWSPSVPHHWLTADWYSWPKMRSTG